MTFEESWEKWVATRPPKVQEAARRFPVGTRFRLHGKVMHVISYEEDVGISITETDPRLNYDKAVRERQPVCACCVGSLESMKL